MSAQFGKLKGFNDLYGSALSPYIKMEQASRLVFSRYGYEEIRPPVLEMTGLFQRGIGQETDVVAKEMFTFTDRKGRSLSLRPEATAGVLRAAIELGLAKPDQVARLFTIGPMFRYERPQLGRQRQFHQINAECLGSGSPYADAELISMLMGFLSQLDLTGLVLKLNSLGCKACRPKYLDALRNYFKEICSNGNEFCEDCARRMEKNPLRVLDCKQDQHLLAKAPNFLDHICSECLTHFEQVKDLLTSVGIGYEIDHHLVRGLDYYCRTTFEVVSGAIGSQTAVAGGGRYDGLISELGGPDAPGVGFACGMERLALLVKAEVAKPLAFFILGLNEEARKAAFSLAMKLRLRGLAGEINYSQGSMKSMMRQVSRSGARFCLILGPEELAAGQIAMKDMETGDQQLVDLGDVEEKIKNNSGL